MADGVLRKEAPFEKDVQWVFWELWHHEGVGLGTVPA